MADYEDETSVLLPCAICSRTFKPQSLEKHVKICERTATKKRKPFDSAKQRIQGTELEEFLPVEQKKKILQEEKRHTSWKQNHDDFIKTIRAARGDSGDTISCRQTTSIVAPGAPTRANEKGLCPTCNRQFGIKAYDRHVAWCKERIVRAPASPATNVAKERLDARMKYRAPLLKNRRMTNREKYAPHSGIKNNSSSNSKAKESQTSLNCNKVNESLSIKQPAVTERRKGGQGKTDSVIASGPVKSRLSDRITKNIDSHNFMALTSSTSSHIFPRIDYPFHDPSFKSSSQISPLLMCHSLSSLKNDKTKETKKRKSKKIQKQPIVSETSICNVKVNDVMTNDVTDMTIRPSNVHRENESMITWKQISNDQNRMTIDEKLIEEGFDGLKDIKWSRSTQKLDQTFSIKESSECSSIDIISKYLHDDESLDKGVRKLESIPGSPRIFNADVTCTSTPVSSREEIRERCHEEKRMEMGTAKEMIDDKCKNISNEEITDEAKKRLNTQNYIMEESNIQQASKKCESTEEVDNELDKSRSNFENNSRISDDRIVLVDEIIPLSNFIKYKNNNIHNSGSFTPSRNFTSDSLDSVGSSRIITMRKRLRKKMHLLRESTDSLVSSLDTSDEITTRKRSQGHIVDVEKETSGVNEPEHRKVRKSLIFPEIVTERKIDRPKSFQEREGTYWKRMTRNSRSRLFYHLMRNPKLPHLLPPIVSAERSSLQTSRVRNGQISDEDLSSPDSYKRPDNKLSADSAYSSLNRKYSNHGHDATDMTNRIDEDVIRRRENEVTSTAKSKMSKFCHECGTRFPETAKFCCECGIQRLAL
ncbi:uncharacterized protein [Chelonus insularis]|uniref:uncharacterized protein isoform X2 n=1 Tax=Chelonus insularis TaxID=460826 RepID=UPI00158F1CB1|nr:uncharacterized protein LOC118064087 isoform X2 [Chelonus insularis]